MGRDAIIKISTKKGTANSGPFFVALDGTMRNSTERHKTAQDSMERTETHVTDLKMFKSEAIEKHCKYKVFQIVNFS